MDLSARLSGKVCIITGSGGSIGRATALRFAAEGAIVVGCDITVDERPKRCGKFGHPAGR